MHDNHQYFEDLKLDILVLHAKKWADKYKLIQRITLHRCIDPSFFRSKNVKYVVVFEYAHKEESFPHIQFSSNFAFDSGSGRLLDERFIEVYRREPDFKFRNEWDFWKKDINTKLPNYIESNYALQIYPQIKTVNQSKMLADYLAGNYPSIMQHEYAFIKIGVIWLVKFNDKITTIHDHKRLKYLIFLLENSSQSFFVYEIENEITGHGILPAEEDYDYYRKMNKEQLEKKEGMKPDNFTSKDLSETDIVGIKKTAQNIWKDLIFAKKNMQKEKIEEANKNWNIMRNHLFSEYGIQVIPTSKARLIFKQMKKPTKEIDKLRTNIQKNLKKSRKDFETILPEFETHLKNSITTGIKCQYKPDPPIKWFIQRDD